MFVKQDLGNGGRFVASEWDPNKKQSTHTYWDSAKSYYDSKKPSYSGGRGGSSQPSYQQPAPQRDYYAEYLAALERARRQKVDAVKRSIDEHAKSAVARYQNQLGQIGDDYQSLRNQSEVERYKAQKSLREALANRGALDSGAGRQETLTLQNNYGNQINRINTEEQHERNNIQSAINEVLAQAEAKKAEAEAAAMESVDTILTQIMNSSAFNNGLAYNQETSKNYASAVKGIKQGDNAFKNGEVGGIVKPGGTGEFDSVEAIRKKFYDSIPYVNKNAQLQKKLALGQIGLEEYARLASQL